MIKPVLPIVRVAMCAMMLAATTRARSDAPAPSAVAATEYTAGAFVVALRRDTQTLARLSPRTEPAFDFAPGSHEAARSGNGYAHVGDLDLRLRRPGEEWRDFASAHHRQPIRSLPTPEGTIAAVDITETMGQGIPLHVERRWSIEDGVLTLSFALANRSAMPVEIGVLGMPMVFDNILTGRTLEQAHAQASFTDPYIGRDAGYLQVTRLNGKGPALLVLPRGRTPLEAYVPLKTAADAPESLFTDRDKHSQTAEGFYDWTVASLGYADREWKHAGAPWNRPTSITLAPGAARTFGVRFVLAPSIRGIEPMLTAQRRPVAIGIPGYVVPTDLDATLFVKAPSAIVRLTSEPDGALDVARRGTVNGWTRLAVRGRRWGPARLAIEYADGETQTVSYSVTKTLEQVAADLGRFATTRQWHEGKGDPFGRSPAILTYDSEKKAIVTQDQRVWIAGMSDEGGAGSWVAAMMKQLDHPDRAEIAKLERMVDTTVVGRLQVADGPRKGAVRKSLFYYDPRRFPGAYDPARNWTTWASWSAKDAADLGRAYNYPHVAIGHWVLYRLARNHVGLVGVHPWRWYLDWAYLTIVAMMRDAPDYADFGLMEGDVFVDILKDLKREGLTDEATTVERLMKARADHWRTLAYPFGSEMPWDSTGQAEVYAWMRYFGYQPQADVTRDVILGYDPTIPGWGYNGNARRYWDFLYGGKTARIERQIHHYGSTLNAVPLFDAYRTDPADTHLLRVAYGGWMGGITNVDRDGFSSAGFHAWPDMMTWDAYSGDYGMGYFGHAYAAATYLVDDPVFGWLGYGGNVTRGRDGVEVAPRDGARARLFVAPTGLWITLAAGKIARAAYDPATGKLTIILDPATRETPVARVFVEQTTANGGHYAPLAAPLVRGGYTVALSNRPTRVTFVNFRGVSRSDPRALRPAPPPPHGRPRSSDNR